MLLSEKVDLAAEVSPNLVNIQKRVKYFYETRIKELGLTETLLDLDAVIFGGLLRDLSANKSRFFKSDIDLVSMEKKSRIQKVLEKKKFPLVTNKYGGFRFSYYGQDFDIWSYEDTWAFKEGMIEASQGFDSLLKTTFFNLDASYFELNKKHFKASNCFIDGVEKRVLDINLKENPFPKKMAERAIDYIMYKNFSMSYNLQLFVIENIDNVKKYKLFLALLEKHLEKNNQNPFDFFIQKDFLNNKT